LPRDEKYGGATDDVTLSVIGDEVRSGRFNNEELSTVMLDKGR